MQRDNQFTRLTGKCEKAGINSEIELCHLKQRWVWWKAAGGKDTTGRASWKKQHLGWAFCQILQEKGYPRGRGGPEQRLGGKKALCGFMAAQADISVSMYLASTQRAVGGEAGKVGRMGWCVCVCGGGRRGVVVLKSGRACSRRQQTDCSCFRGRGEKAGV